MRELLWIILTLNFSEMTECKLVSVFGVPDLNDLCVFGTVAESIPKSEEEVTDCVSDADCQVAVRIKNIFLEKSSQNDTILLVSVYPKGQSLQTLSNMYLTLAYPDNYNASFLVSFWNLNGFHKDLLESILFEIPLEGWRFRPSHDLMILKVSSKCACGDIEDHRPFEINKIPKLDGVNHSCYSGDRTSFRNAHKHKITAALIVWVCVCPPILAPVVLLIRAQKYGGTLKRKQSLEKFEESEAINSVSIGKMWRKVGDGLDAWILQRWISNFQPTLWRFSNVIITHQLYKNISFF